MSAVAPTLTAVRSFDNPEKRPWMWLPACFMITLTVPRINFIRDPLGPRALIEKKETTMSQLPFALKVGELRTFGEGRNFVWVRCVQGPDGTIYFRGNMKSIGRRPQRRQTRR